MSLNASVCHVNKSNAHPTEHSWSGDCFCALMSCYILQQVEASSIKLMR